MAKAGSRKGRLQIATARGRGTRGAGGRWRSVAGGTCVICAREVHLSPPPRLASAAARGVCDDCSSAEGERSLHLRERSAWGRAVAMA